MNVNKDSSFQSTKRQDRLLPEDSFGDWKWREGLAELMVPVVGSLYRDGINILIYGKSLVNQSPVEIMRAHRFARQSDQNELSELETFPILQYLDTLNVDDIDIENTTTKSVKLELKHENKPDLLAYELYGNSKLWWVFALFNQDKLKDPIIDFKEGVTIKVPVRFS